MSFSTENELDNLSSGTILKHDFVMPWNRIQGDINVTYYNSEDVSREVSLELNNDKELMKELEEYFSKNYNLEKFGKFEYCQNSKGSWNIFLQVEYSDIYGLPQHHIFDISVSHERMHFCWLDKRWYPDVPERHVEKILEICNKYREKFLTEYKKMHEDKLEKERKKEEERNNKRKQLEELLKEKNMSFDDINRISKERGCSSCWNSFPWTTENIANCIIKGCSGYSYYNGD